jgi:hypothetical protein
VSADTAARRQRVDAVTWISGALAVGCALLAVGHLGVQIPLLSTLGPGGGRAVVPAATAFTVAAILQALVAVGVARRRSWAWPLGVLVAVVTLVGAAMPFRGTISAIGMLLAAAELVLLLTGDVRRAILR